MDSNVKSLPASHARILAAKASLSASPAPTSIAAALKGKEKGTNRGKEGKRKKKGNKGSDSSGQPIFYGYGE